MLTGPSNDWANGVSVGSATERALDHLPLCNERHADLASSSSAQKRSKCRRTCLDISTHRVRGGTEATETRSRSALVVRFLAKMKDVLLGLLVALSMHQTLPLVGARGISTAAYISNDLYHTSKEPCFSPTVGRVWVCREHVLMTSRTRLATYVSLLSPLRGGGAPPKIGDTSMICSKHDLLNEIQSLI